MESRPRQVENYLSPHGRDCFQDWLRTIGDGKARQALRLRLNRVAQGNFGDCRPVGEGVHELRINVGPGYRVYFGEDGDKVILLGGSRKDDQQEQIKSAKDRWREYNA